MTTATPTWAVVATVDEHPALLQNFVAWHRALGAAAIALYFDCADDPAADLFQDQPDVRVIRCDPHHWMRLGKRRPDKHQIRQTRNAQHAFRHTGADWLLHCDADEFLWPAGDVGASLAQVYPWIESAIVPVAERCHIAGQTPAHVLEGVFRRPRAGARGPAALTQRGLTGHAIGKAFVRVGADVKMSIHRPQRKDPPVKIAHLDGVELLHFDGLTRLHWIYKLLRKADAFAHHSGMTPTPHRQMQIDAVLHDPALAGALHDQLKVLSPEDAAQLEAQGLLLRATLDPAVPLAPATFDGWLRAQKKAGFPLLDDIT